MLSVIAPGQKGARVAFDVDCEHRSSYKLSFLFVKGLVCTGAKLFQAVFQTFAALLKLIVIFGHANWITQASALFKSCLKE